VPDDDARLTQVLDRVAATGQTSARLVPPSSLRRRAGRRTAHRRELVIGAVVVAVIAGVSVAGGPTGTTNTDPRPQPAAPTDPVPTELATDPPVTDRGVRHLAPSMLVTAEQVTSTLGFTWDPTSGPDPDGRKSLTPCQAGADPSAADRRTAQSVTVTGGWSGDDTVSQLLEEYPDDETARAAYARAVDWFATCGGLGVDQTDGRRSLARRAAERPAVAGVDNMRMLVRMREKVASESWTNTVATVVRAGNLVTVLAWDVTIDDNPGAYDSGFVDLSRQVAERLAGNGAPRELSAVPDDALLPADDPAVVAALGGEVPADQQSVLGGRDGVPNMDPLCNGGLSPVAPGTLAVRSPQIAGRDTSAIVIEDVVLHESAQSAVAAADAAVARVGECPAAKLLPGTRRQLPADTGVHGGAWSGTRSLGPDERRVTAVITSGRFVAYLLIDSLNRVVSDAEAAAVVETARARLVAASSG
jgi:hypothetical protein